MEVPRQREKDDLQVMYKGMQKLTFPWNHEPESGEAARIWDEIKPKFEALGFSIPEEVPRDTNFNELMQQLTEYMYKEFPELRPPMRYF